MLGTWVNVLAILAGTVVGTLAGRGLGHDMRETVMQGIGLATLLIGLQMALTTSNILLVLASLVLGGALGAWGRLEDRLEALVRWVESKVAPQTRGTVARAFITATLIFCVGAMAIVGPLESGLIGQHRTLYAKSMLDGVTSAMLASTMGAGVALSALPVLAYQGGVTLLAASLQHVLTGSVIREMAATGGLLIVGIGINLLGIKNIRVADLLPALLVAILLTWLVEHFF